MNNVTLVGRLATEPRLEETNGNPICTFAHAHVNLPRVAH